MSERGLTCREVVEIIPDYLEDGLAPEDRRRVEDHLRICDGCTNYLEQMRETIRLTGMLSEEQIPEEQKAGWADPTELGKAFVWLAAQPPERYTGLRFDAGPIADAIAAEGYHFAFKAEKVTLYPEDFAARLRWYASYED